MALAGYTARRKTATSVHVSNTVYVKGRMPGGQDTGGQGICCDFFDPRLPPFCNMHSEIGNSLDLLSQLVSEISEKGDYSNAIAPRRQLVRFPKPTRACPPARRNATVHAALVLVRARNRGAGSYNLAAQVFPSNRVRRLLSVFREPAQPSTPFFPLPLMDIEALLRAELVAEVMVPDQAKFATALNTSFHVPHRSSGSVREAQIPPRLWLLSERFRVLSLFCALLGALYALGGRIACVMATSMCSLQSKMGSAP